MIRANHLQITMKLMTCKSCLRKLYVRADTRDFVCDKCKLIMQNNKHDLLDNILSNKPIEQIVNHNKNGGKTDMSFLVKPTILRSKHDPKKFQAAYIRPTIGNKTVAQRYGAKEFETKKQALDWAKAHQDEFTQFIFDV